MNKKWLKVALFLLVFAVLIWVAVLVRNNFVSVRGGMPTPFSPPPHPSEIIDRMKGDRFLFENFSLVVLSDWKKIDVAKTPLEGADVLFAFSKDGTSCTLAYVESDSLVSGPEWLQASWGPRIFTTDNDQLDGNWYVGAANKPANFEFTNNARQPLSGEMLVYYYGINGLNAQRDSFILFTNNSQPVSKVCVEDTRDILSSLQREYTETALSPQSNGYLYFRRSGQGESESYPLLFLPSGSQVEQKVFTFPPYPHSLTAYRNKFYYGGPSPEWGRVSLYELNPFTKKIKSITSMPKRGYAYINDILLQGDEVFYTYGEECSRQDRCSIDLYRAFLTTGEVEVLASQIKFPGFVGYDDAANALKLYWAYGDAGCYASNTADFNLATKQLETAGKPSFGSCSEDADSAEDQARRKSFFDQFGGDKIRADFFRVENGQILLPKVGETIDKESFPVNFIAG